MRRVYLAAAYLVYVDFGEVFSFRNDDGPELEVVLREIDGAVAAAAILVQRGVEDGRSDVVIVVVVVAVVDGCDAVFRARCRLKFCFDLRLKNSFFRKYLVTVHDESLPRACFYNHGFKSWHCRNFFSLLLS